jgi:hypothetical protein
VGCSGACPGAALGRLNEPPLGVYQHPGGAHRLSTPTYLSAVAELISSGSLSRLYGSHDKDPMSLPMCVAAGIVVLPFVMRFYLGSFGVKRRLNDALLACALGSRPLE